MDPMSDRGETGMCLVTHPLCAVYNGTRNVHKKVRSGS